MPRAARTGNCDMCGRAVRSLIESPRCQPCRRIESKPTAGGRGHSACEQCGVAMRATLRRGVRTRFCSHACYGLSQRIRDEADRRVTRWQRDKSAPGLTVWQRRRLLNQWRAQARSCTYGCGRLASTVDHVVPLIRGGTNFEGNLVPACRACNASKCARLLTEWRYARAA